MASITYRFSVTATFGLAASDADVDFYTEAQAVSVQRRRELEKSLHALLRRFEGADCDCELLDFSIEEDTHDGDCDCVGCRIDRAASAVADNRDR